MQYGYSILDVVYLLAFTAIIYVGPPAVYVFAIKKGQLSAGAVKKTCIISGIAVWLICFFLSAFLEIEKGGNPYAAVLWSSIAYWVISKKINSQNAKQNDCQATPNPPQEQKETSIVNTNNKPEGADSCETIPQEPNTVENKESLSAHSERGVKGTIPEKELLLLKELYDKGILSEQEFSEKKKQLLKL